MSTALVILQDVPQMSLCSVCPKPGSCCAGFILENDRGEITYWADSWEQDCAEQMREFGYPFLPMEVSATFRDEESGRDYVSVRYRCPKLKDGRCSIYAGRPDVCRNFVPASRGLCVFGGPHG